MLLIDSGNQPELGNQEEKMDIAGEKRCIVLSTDQQDFLTDVSLNKPKAVLIHGSSGSGKTMLGVEAAKLLTNQLRGEMPETKVYFCQAASGDKRFKPQLLPSLEKKYLLPVADENTKYLGLWDLCHDLDIPVSDDNIWMEPLINVVRHLSISAGEKQSFLFVDEVTVRNKRECDFGWMDQIVEECPNMTLILCLRPVGRSQIVQGPVGDKTAVVNLHTQFRYSPSIQKLLAFMSVSAGEEKPALPDNISDLPDDRGELPIWLHAIDKKHVNIAMSDVKNLVGEGESVSVVCNVPKEDVGSWCKENEPGWKYYPGDNRIHGCEDETMVVVGTWPGYSMNWREYLSRAQRRLYLITREGEDNHNHKNVMKWLGQAEQQGLVRKFDIGEDTYSTIAKMEGEIKRLEVENAKIESDKRTDIAKLQDELKELRAENARMQEELKHSTTENAKLQEDFGTMRNELNREKEEKNEKENKENKMKKQQPELEERGKGGAGAGADVET